MIELKEAIKKSFHYLDEMLYDGKDLPNKLLEEIEYDDEQDIWKVVIGFDTDKVITTQQKSPYNFAMGGTTEKKTERKYKQIQLRGNDGKFLKMIDQML